MNKKINLINQWDVVSEAVGLGKLSDMLGPKEEERCAGSPGTNERAAGVSFGNKEEPCEFCTHDTPCKMHYVEYTKKNAVELRELEPNENF